MDDQSNDHTADAEDNKSAQSILETKFGGNQESR
jgi:hypothetical protein